jgi:hypothetical protein
MTYGWSTKQLARVNARRAARGQKPLTASIRSEKDAEDYDTEYSKQYGRRRKSIEEEDDETQVVDKDGKRRLGTAKTSRLDEYKKMLADRGKEKALAKGPRVLSSPYGTEIRSLA